MTTNYNAIFLVIIAAAKLQTKPKDGLCNDYSNELHNAPVFRGWRPNTLIFSRTLSLHIRSTIRQTTFSGKNFGASAEIARHRPRLSEHAVLPKLKMTNEIDVINAQHPERKAEMRW